MFDLGCERSSWCPELVGSPAGTAAVVEKAIRSAWTDRPLVAIVVVAVARAYTATYLGGPNIMVPIRIFSTGIIK